MSSPSAKNTVACDRWYPDIDSFFRDVKKAGMPYFEWNGSLYEVDGEEFHFVGPMELVAA